jgi:hypothetical protein
MTKKKVVVLAFALFISVSGMLIFVAPASAQTTETPAEEDDVYDELMFRHSDSVTLHDVEYDSGVAIVYMSSDGGGETVQVTASRDTTGQNNRQTTTLQEGENVVRVELHDGVQAITIDADGNMYTHIGDSNTNLAPNLSLWKILMIVGAAASLSVLIGWELIERYQNLTPKRVR